jgi:hypothetical protein
LRVSDLPFPQPYSDSDRIANALWLLDNNPTGQALLPAEYRDDAGPRFAAVVPAANDHAIADGIAARLAEENTAAAGRQSGDIQPQIGPVLLAQNTGGKSGHTSSRYPVVPPQDAKFHDFFNQHYEPVARVATQLGVDPTLILGVAAHESGWGQSRQATQLNNPFGRTPDGKTPTVFPSVGDAWAAWAKTHGSRIESLGGDAEAFVDRLLLDNRNVYGPTIGDRRGAYNSDKPAQWRTGVLDAIRSVRNRSPQWQTLQSFPLREE